MTNQQLKETRELCYGMVVANLNSHDVEDYMAIASACARMESRRAIENMIVSASSQCPNLSSFEDSDLNEPLPTRTCNVGDGECESCQ